MRKLRVPEILITSAFGSAALAGLSAAVDVPEGAAVLSGVGVLLAAGGICGVARTPGRSPGGSRKPDYRRIAELEQDIFGQIYEHEGAPHSHFYQGDPLACRCGARRPREPHPPKSPRPPEPPAMPYIPAHPYYRSSTVYIQAGGPARVQVSGGISIQAGRDISIGGSVSATGWDGWSAAVQAASAHMISVNQRSLLAASGLEPVDELKALMNWPRCPGCGKFSQGSTGSPQLCSDCEGLAQQGR